MSSLLNSIDKKPYQAYTLEHGIERIKIQIPLAEVQNFEKAFAKAIETSEDSKSNLLEIMKSCNGSIMRSKK